MLRWFILSQTTTTTTTVLRPFFRDHPGEPEPVPEETNETIFIYRRGTLQLMYTYVRKIPLEKACSRRVTLKLKVSQGRWNCRYSIRAISFPIDSLSSMICSAPINARMYTVAKSTI